MPPVIQVRGLGKLYRIGARRSGASLRETLSQAASHLTERLRRQPRRPRLDATELWALRDVSFDVEQGEVTGILGRNGAGKSTLLKILSRITDPTEGEAILHGHVASLLEVGTGFHGDLTGRENIFLNGAILGMSRREIARKFDEIVAFAEVDRFIDTQVKHYSSGMYMRLAFAVAAHMEPDILVVDEVLAVGDTAFQRKCLGKMKDVAGQGRTVLFVSHNMQAVRTLCHTAVWLDEGRIRERGLSEEVIEHYVRAADEELSGEEIQKFIARVPPDPLFRLIDISVRQQGVRTNTVLSGKPVDIEVKFQTLDESQGLHVYIRLFDTDGTMLLESNSNGADFAMWSMKAGTWRIAGQIPGDLLAERRYILHVGVAIAHGNRYLLPEPYTVRLDATASGVVNSVYPGYMTPARLAPLFPWVAEEIGD
jgi:lipopolysaccharide transport system ATP-binding protein